MKRVVKVWFFGVFRGALMKHVGTVLQVLPSVEGTELFFLPFSWLVKKFSRGS